MLHLLIMNKYLPTGLMIFCVNDWTAGIKIEIVMKKIIKRITRSAIIVEINTKDVKLVKTNISSLHSKRHLYFVITHITQSVNKKTKLTYP